MNKTVYRLEHYDGLKHAEAPNPEVHDGKHIGTYTDEARAMEGLHRVADQEGLRDWPDGFRLFEIEVDRDHWREGFVPGPEGADAAIAGDSSGIIGSDAGLAEWSSDESRDVAEEEERLRAFDPAEKARWIWDLWHFKISEMSDSAYDDMGMKLVGLYSSEEEAKRAIDRLRDKPGFRDWPRGFRLYGGPPDHDNWLEGYATED